MKVDQLSVFIENAPGRVSEVTELLGEAAINIRGFSVADTQGFGILRLVVDKPKEAARLLKGSGFAVKETEVVCLKLEDHPGALADALRVVSEAGVNVEYIYSLVSTYVVLNVTDTDLAIELLRDRPVHLVGQEEISAV